MQYLTKGQRGVVYTDQNKEIIIKIGEEFRIKNEAIWLEKLNKYNIGPKLIKHQENYLVLKYIKGKQVSEYFKEVNKQQIINIIKEILKQCRTLDKLKVNKLEMNHPFKHILIENKKPIMIDFEKCTLTENTKNVTQFFQYLMSNNLEQIFNKKSISINKKEFIKKLKNYKDNNSDENFSNLLSLIK
ncbi:hypothetical protein CL617_03870 [archaeon]|nr:hypothetical protein [archaeon]|tara:strand:- start:22256 stop:22816 length:561 start_codon:yes stop_codon:yes gene_type:complete